MINQKISVAMLGATGAVGTQVLKKLLQIENVDKISILGRRKLNSIKDYKVQQHIIDIFNPSTYNNILYGHHVAICTLGIGEPSKVSKKEFVRVDKLAVLDFAKACKQQGISHFELLSSISTHPKSASFYLRIKGELNAALEKLEFDRLSIFQPSMILTPKNRYGFSQAIILKVWPLLSTLMFGPLKKFRGIKVEHLGSAMAKNILSPSKSIEYLSWQEFNELNQ